MKKVLFILCFICSQVSSAQVSNDAKMLIDDAVDLMRDSSYQEANKKFIAAINTKSILPDNFCYLFGVNLYHSGFKQRSIALLEKYIQLRGKSGTYYNKSLYYLNLLQPESTSLETDPKTGDTTRIKYNSPVKPAPCKSGDLIKCPICDGTGVIITRGAFGESYQSCEYSDEHGHMDCDHYQLYLKGMPVKY